jgi:hypothetical protein
MNQVYNILDVITVNYNYYVIVFQCYPMANVLFDLLGRKFIQKFIIIIFFVIGKMDFKKKIIHIMIFDLKKLVFYIISEVYIQN